MYRCNVDSITGRDRQYLMPDLRRLSDGSRAVDEAGVELPLCEPSDDVLARLSRTSTASRGSATS